MAFVTKTWKDRLVEYAGRRKLKNVATGEEVLMDVSRSEGTVSQAGDAFSAANMNNLEQRIKNEFDTVNSSLISGDESFNYGIKDGVRGFYTSPLRADDSFIPFKSGFVNIELYYRYKSTSTNYPTYTFTEKGDYLIIPFWYLISYTDDIIEILNTGYTIDSLYNSVSAYYVKNAVPNVTSFTAMSSNRVCDYWIFKIN